MVSAVVLITVDRGKINDVAETLAAMKGVSEVYSVGGRYDLVAIIRVSNNESMAVLQVEDWHESANSIEVVLFPRTWGKVMALVESEEIADIKEGEVIRVSGKFDISRGDPQIIGDVVAQNFKYVTKADAPVEIPVPEPEWAVDEPEPPPFFDDELPPPDDHFVDMLDKEESPPPVEYEPVEMVTSPEIEPELVDEKLDANYRPPDFMRQDRQPPSRCLLKVRLPRSGDDGKDRRRLRRLHGLLVSYHGEDCFAIVIEAHDGTEVEIAFPNDSTGYCDDLIHSLLPLVETEDNIEIHRL